MLSASLTNTTCASATTSLRRWIRTSLSLRKCNLADKSKDKENEAERGWSTPHGGGSDSAVRKV